MKKFFLIIFTALTVLLFSACSEQSEKTIAEIEKPQQPSSIDEVYIPRKEDAVEDSANVNGRRYTLNLEEFTGRYNEIMLSCGGMEYLNYANWKKSGESQTDINGVEYDCYYYDADKIEFTAVVETVSQKLMNVGCGTTMNTFVSKKGEENYSDIILNKSAVMAAAVCGYSSGDVDVLQDVFYRTTFENVESLVYEGNVFNLSIKENSDSEKSTLLFRCFPITEENQADWKVQTYEEYIATIPSSENTDATNR